MMNYFEDVDYGYEGDARRCPRHPHVKTSSDDGMFDTCCGVCEAEMSEAEAQEEWDALAPEVKARYAAEAAAAKKYADDCRQAELDRIANDPDYIPF